MSGLHWEVAEMLVEQLLKPVAGDPVVPEAEGFAREWYRATSAWMQRYRHYDSRHLERGLELFRNDRVLLFLSGTEHESYAMPDAQAARVSRAVEDGGVPQPRTFFREPVESPKDEWARAESFYRQVVSMDPGFAEARMRYGRALTALGRYREAVSELRTAIAALGDDDQLQYYGQMFLGDAEEQLGDLDAARQRYARSQVLFPGAQKPRLAMSQLDFRRDRRQQASESIAGLLKQASDPDSDPWTTYDVSHVRNADQQLAAVWRSVSGTK